MKTIVWKVAVNKTVKTNSEDVIHISGEVIPTDAVISDEHLTIKGNCNADSQRIQGIFVSFVSEGSFGSSYLDKIDSPVVHYENGLHISPGMDNVDMKVVNGCGEDYNIEEIEYTVNYSVPEQMTTDDIIEQDASDVNESVIGIDPYQMLVKFKKLYPNAVIPTYAHNGDVGMDMTAVRLEYDVEHDVYIYYTGLALETEYGYGVFLYPRSSNSKTDAYLTNHVGIVDSALYRGEVQFRYKNRHPYRKSFKEWITGKVDVKRALKFAPYQVGDRVGQMVVFSYPQVVTQVVDELSETVRGAGGFGSTGK